MYIIYIIIIIWISIWCHDLIKINSLSIYDISIVLFNKIRYFYFCPYNSYIYPGCQLIFQHPGNITIGNQTFLNRNVHVYAEQGKVTIGNRCLIGFNTSISTATHTPSYRFEDRVNPIYKEVSIGNNVWIGSNVCIIGGVTIGDNSIISAGSLVHKNIPKNSMYGGNPARFIRNIRYGRSSESTFQISYST